MHVRVGAPARSPAVERIGTGRIGPMLLFIPLVAGVVGALAPAPSAGQDLEPRAFSPAPVGLNFAVLAYGYSAGNIFFDPSLPIEGAEGTVHNATFAYVRTLNLFGFSAKLSGIAPFAWGDWQGTIDGEFRSTSRRGLADPTVQLAVNFIGAPALGLREMVAYQEGTIVGASLLIVVPLGQYDPERLINLGTNRWIFGPRIGFSHRIGRWTLEAFASARVFTDNPESFGSTTLEQDPLWGLAADGIYAFKRGWWLGVGAGIGAGARTIVSGVPQDTYQRNVRLGATMAIPLSRRHSVKATYLRSVRTERGTDFDTVSLAYQVRWGGGI